MKILAIDYGRKKIGLAVGDTDIRISQPLAVIRFTGANSALKKIVDIIKVEEIDILLIGLSGGVVDDETKTFGRLLEKQTNKEIIYWDEKFSTRDAIDLSIESGMKQSKRKKMEDAYAAAVILDNYFEINDL